MLFKYITKKSFSYAGLQHDRSVKITEIQESFEGAKESSGLKILYQFHPYVGYTGKTGGRPWTMNPTQFNEYGMLSMPGHTYPYHKKEGDFVVAILGGSVAEIFANTMEESLNQYLRDRYGFKRRIVLISLATGGYKQPQQLFHLQYALLSGFEFDAVLNIDGFNDLALASYNMDNHINPVFPSGHHIGGLSKLMSETLDFQTAKQLAAYYELNKREIRLLTLISLFPVRYSPFFNLLGELWTVRTENKIALLKYTMTENAQKTMPKELRGPSIESGNKYELVSGIWMEASEMLNAICRAEGIIYVHFLQPNQYFEGSKPLSEKERKIAIKPNNLWGTAAKEGYHFLVSKGKELKTRGIPFYDLTMVFKNTKEDIYTDGCCHFGKEGNEIMGREIADILMKEIKRQKKE